MVNKWKQLTCIQLMATFFTEGKPVSYLPKQSSFDIDQRELNSPPHPPVFIVLSPNIIALKGCSHGGKYCRFVYVTCVMMSSQNKPAETQMSNRERTSGCLIDSPAKAQMNYYSWCWIKQRKAQAFTRRGRASTELVQSQPCLLVCKEWTAINLRSKWRDLLLNPRKGARGTPSAMWSSERFVMLLHFYCGMVLHCCKYFLL